MPRLILESLENGERLPADLDRIGIENGPLLLLSIAGDPEMVGLLGGADYVTVTIFGQRSNLQYALGAAAAIVLAQESGGGISDDRRFFSEAVQTSPDAMFDRLHVPGAYKNYREAADAIQWGPGAS